MRQGHALAFLVGETSADGIAALLAFPGVLENLEVGSLFRLRGDFGTRCHGLFLFCNDPFGRCRRLASSRVRRQAGKLGETFRGNRGFLLTLEAHANGRGLEHAQRVCTEKADNTEQPDLKQEKTTESIETGAGKSAAIQADARSPMWCKLLRH